MDSLQIAALAAKLPQEERTDCDDLLRSRKARFLRHQLSKPCRILSKSLHSNSPATSPRPAYRYLDGVGSASAQLTEPMLDRGSTA